MTPKQPSPAPSRWPEYLSTWLGIPVNYTTGTSYNAVIEAMASGHTNCGTVGPFSYLLGVQEAGAVALGVGSQRQQGQPGLRPDPESVLLQRDLGQEGERHRLTRDLRATPSPSSIRPQPPVT